MSLRKFAIWLLLSALVPSAGATPGDVPEGQRQQILAQLKDEVMPAQLGAAKVFLSGDLAAVGSPAGTGEPAVIVFERPAGDDDGWRAVARISAPGEEHFGDAVLLSPSAILVAAPDTVGAGLGPGATYVFQRNVGGKERWGLVAKLALDAYPLTGAVTVQQLATSPTVASPPVVTEPPTVVVEPPPPVAAELPPPAVAEPPPPDNTSPPPVAAPPAAVEVTEDTPDPPATADESAHDGSRSASTGDLHYIAIANMREKPRALALASSLRDQGYPSEVHRNYRNFFVVTLARLPFAEARKQRDAAVAAGDISQDAYLIVGTSFREKISAP